MRTWSVLSSLAGGLLLAGCQTNGRDFAEIEAEAAAQPVRLSVRVESPGAPCEPLPREKIVGKWECNFQSDISDFRPTLPSPKVSVIRFRDVLTLMDDGVYFKQHYQNGKLTVNTDGLWKYEDGVLTLIIEGNTRHQYSTLWYGDDVWEERYYPESGVVDWWRSFYERRHPGYVCSTSGGYRPDGCLRLIHKLRRVTGSGYIVDTIDTPKVFRRVVEGGTK